MNLRPDARGPNLHVGEDVTIGEGVEFGANVVVHDGCSIGAGTVVAGVGVAGGSADTLASTSVPILADKSHTVPSITGRQLSSSSASARRRAFWA